METWYKVDRWNYIAVPVQVEKIGEKSITIVDTAMRRTTESISSDWYTYCKTSKDMALYLRHRLDLEQERLRHHEEELKATLKKLKVSLPRKVK